MAFTEHGLVSVPIVEAMKLWGELVECYHNRNGYGGRTAELYAYRFCQDDPRRRLEDCEIRRQAEIEASRQAANGLHDLCRLFCEVYEDARIKIDNLPPHQWWQEMHFAGRGFNHRVHVTVNRRRKGESNV